MFRMADVRGASLGAHAAARETKKGSAACLAARAAGHAVATAHVAQHAFGAAIYALRAVAVAELNAEVNVSREWDWQMRRAPEGLRERIRQTIVIRKRDGKVSLAVRKGRGF